MNNWETFHDFFSVLNKHCNYLILRNFEQLPNGRLIKGHEDIDLLCDNTKKLVKIAKAIPRKKVDDGVSYFIWINHIKIPLDIRQIGDGYYDKNWQIHMLKNKRLYKNCIYIMNNEDFFYSFIYHSLIQKPTLSHEYRIKLENMAQKKKIQLNKAEDLKNNLLIFMNKRKYYFTNPAPAVYINFEGIPKKMIRINIIRYLQKVLFEIKN